MKPRILFVNGSAEKLKDIVKYQLSCSVDFITNSEEVLAKDPLRYDVTIIDASDDEPVGLRRCLSEYLKLKNPDMIIIGTGFKGESFLKNGLAKQLYDERISFDLMDTRWIERIKEILTNKYHFDFSDE